MQVFSTEAQTKSGEAEKSFRFMSKEREDLSAELEET